MSKNKNLGIFYLAGQNLRRKLFRSLVTITAVGIVAIIIFPATILGEGVSRSLDQGTARLGADMMVAPPGYTFKLESTLIKGEPSTFTMDGSVEDQIRRMPGVAEVSPQLYFATLASG